MSFAGDGQESGLDRRVADLRQEILQRDRAALAQRTGAVRDNGGFLLAVWNRCIAINGQDFIAVDRESGQSCDPLTQAMLAYYFYTSDGYPAADEWIAFRDLPDGQFYSSAFQGYTGNKLARVFGDDIAAFTRAARSLDGRRLAFGDAAYSFQAVPRIHVAAVCWLGDEDFPTSYRILFDRSIEHHLPTDACAILGSMLTTRLTKAMVSGVNS
ncbi:MAG: DUF3786 domain-containing protein [Candidatus Promineifilaceae bacterium]